MKLLLTLATAHASQHPRGSPRRRHKQLKTIFENNRRWVQEEVKKDKRFPTLTGWLLLTLARRSCGSGVRIHESLPIMIMGLDAGDVFVARNVANQVIGTDMSMMSVIQRRERPEGADIVIVAIMIVAASRKPMENFNHVPLGELAAESGITYG